MSRRSRPIIRQVSGGCYLVLTVILAMSTSTSDFTASVGRICSGGRGPCRRSFREGFEGGAVEREGTHTPPYPAPDGNFPGTAGITKSG